MYGFHKSKMMTKKIANLEANGLITDCKGPWGPYFCLQRNITKRAVSVLSISFGDFVSTTDHWTVVPLATNFLYPAALAVSKISVIRVDLFQWFPWIYGVAIIKLEFGEVIKRSSPLSLPGELRRHLKLCISVLIMFQYFTLLWYSICAKSGCFCLRIWNVLFRSILFMLQLSVMIRLSLMIFYFTLTMYPHFFTNFLVLFKCLPDITCLLN